MKIAKHLANSILLFAAICIPSIASSSILTYSINFGPVESTGFGEPPIGLFSLNSNFQLDSQSRILQEDILSFEVTSGRNGFLTFDLTDLISSPLNITLANGLFYFNVAITDTDYLESFCSDPNYIPDSSECIYARFTMSGNAEFDYTYYSVNHNSLLSNGEWSGYLEWPAGATLISTSPVPIPSTVWLFLSGFAGMSGFKKLRKQGTA